MGLLPSVEFSSSGGATVDHSNHRHIKKWIITQISGLSDLENTDGLTGARTHTNTRRVRGVLHHPSLPSPSHFVYILLPPGCPSVSLLSSTLIYSSALRFNHE